MDLEELGLSRQELGYSGFNEIGLSIRFNIGFQILIKYVKETLQRQFINVQRRSLNVVTMLLCDRFFSSQ